MSSANTPDIDPHPERTDRTPPSLEDWLLEVSSRIDPEGCDDLTELGLYSIHDGSARTITLPTDAERFNDASNVKQYYFEGGECPLLIVAGVTI